MSNHHKTSQNNVTWCYLFNLRYGCKKANHSTLCSGLVGLLRILVICTDAAGCTDAGLVKHFFFNHGPAMTSNTQQHLINPIYILLHPFTSVLDNVSENIRKLFQHSTRRSKGSQQSPTLAMGSRPEQTLHELTRWLDDFAWLSDFWAKTNDRSGISRNFQQHLFDPCSYNATTFSKQKNNITVPRRLLEYIGVHDVGLVSTTASWHPQIISNPTCSERFTPRPSIWLMGQHEISLSSGLREPLVLPAAEPDCSCATWRIDFTSVEILWNYHLSLQYKSSTQRTQTQALWFFYMASKLNHPDLNLVMRQVYDLCT